MNRLEISRLAFKLVVVPHAGKIISSGKDEYIVPCGSTAQQRAHIL